MIPILLLLFLAAFSFAGLVRADDVDDATPPPAPGYASKAEILAAFARGEVKPVPFLRKTPAGVTVKAGVTYREIEGTKLQLDLYAPAESPADARNPCVVLIHGGGWKTGRREDYRYYGEEFALRGYVAASISYRLSGVAPYPAAVDDCEAALRWLRDHAADYNIDPKRIAVVGGSAGGHLALMLGYRANDPKHPGVPVRAVVDIYGVYDMATPYGRDHSLVRSFLGNASYAEKPGLFAEASPKSYLDAGDPPTLILHGTIDEVVPVTQSDNLAARLAELKIPCVYDKLEGWPHAMDIAKCVNDRCLWQMERFLAEHLKAGE